MPDSSSQNDAGPMDPDKTHVVPPPTPPSPVHLVHENAGRLLAGMLGSAPGSWEQEGDVIGPYRLCEIIGEGGFGNVWHAEQTEVIKREVALKLIKPGMDSAQVLGRFNQERQALASLKHPNIATLLDAGVGPNGRPYFAMELVHGGPVTDWCKAADATLQERLRLFIQICHAVQHAHEKGILHRDIKPTNILVADINGQPVPKVIDFGVAKALNDSSLEELTLLTQADQAVGTPLYMSPEQIQGGRELDSRSDVYALGVLLYELLTGSLPFDTTTAAARGVEGLKRLILDTVPERPSTRVRRRTSTHQRKPKKGFEASLFILPADLDWITMRALEKDRQRRYSTAAEFAADIQRHLDCQPVLARPPSISYRTGRWMRRNCGVLVPACVALALSAMAVLVFRHFATQAPGGPARPLISADVPKPTFTNSLGMQFIPVPDTKVLFCIHETRRQDYAVFAAEVPSVDGTWRQGVLGSTLAEADHPVTNVNWDDARAFCAWLSRKDSKAYRLPTDHEWSLAVGLKETAPVTHETVANHFTYKVFYPWGQHKNPRPDDGNYSTGTDARFGPDSDGFHLTAPVGSYKPNPFGLYDMGGNVWEWCAFEPARGRTAEAQRGASYETFTEGKQRATYRHWVHAPTRTSSAGFRVVLEADASPAEVTEAGTLSASVAASSRQPAEENAKLSMANSLGMKFLPVPGTKVLFCIHETRQGDYAAYAAEVTDLNDNWRRNRGPFEDDHPVSFINLQEAQRFCAWLSRKEGKTYRLPTDHEWSLAVGLDEKAPLTHETLQAGPLNTTHYPWNGHFPPEAADGNYAGKEWLKSEARHHSKVQLSGCDDGFLVTSPVMSFRPNPFGLYDMGGNLEELCVFPPDAEGKRTEVLRGAWFFTQTTPENLLSSYRAWPTSPTIRGGSHGFRVVLEIGSEAAAASGPSSVQ